MNYTDWAMKELDSLPNTKSAYLYKQKIIADMTEKANELASKGIKDNNVINSLIADEFSTIRQDYYDIKKQKEEKNKKTKTKKLIIVGSITYIFLLVVAYLIISFTTLKWSRTWLVFVVGLLVPASVGMLLSSFKLNGKTLAFSLTSRLLSAGAVMLLTVTGFLLTVGVWAKSWLLFIIGVAFMILLDLILAFRAKQKTVLITSLIYIPAIAALVYAALGILSVVSWHPGWLIVVISVLIDLVIICISVLKGSKPEEDEQWEDD